jgi:APA family basic amino acid/polyamine antiporter
MDSQNERPPNRAALSGLIPSFGLFTTVTLVVGGVIGSGIFRKPGVMAAQLGSPGLLLAVWVLAALLTLFGALTNAEVASMIPETGGQYIFFERMYGPFFAYLYGWSVFSVIQSGSIAALAYVFAEYTSPFFHLPDLAGPLGAWSFHLPFIGDVTPFNELGFKALAAVLIILLTAINYLGVKLGGLVQNIFTISKVAAMVLLMIAALLPQTGGHFSNLTTSSATIHPHGLALLAAMAAAMQGAFWAFDGWNKLTYIAGEVKEPQRTIPRGLIFGMLIVTAIYLLMNLAYSYVLPIDTIAGSKLVAADVAEKCISGGAKWIALGVMISTLGAANATILATARVYFSMARRNTVPQIFGRAHPRFHTPAASLVIQGVWSILLLFSGTFDRITDTLIFVSWVFYAAGAYGVFVLRRKEPNAVRPYKVPGYPVVPWLFVLFALLYLVLTICNDISGYLADRAAGKPALINSALGMALVFIGAPFYFIAKTRKPSAKS